MISLSKNKTVNLSKEANGVSKFQIRLKWDMAMNGQVADADVSALLCNTDKKVKSENDFIFYNNLESSCGSVKHNGDSRDGAGDGWDEIINIDFSKMNADTAVVPIMLSIHDETNTTTFGQVSNLTVDIFDAENNKIVAEFYPELENDSDNLMVVGEFANKNGKAFFKALGEGTTEGLAKALSYYGISASN